MQQKMTPGQRVMLYGTPKKRGLCWEISHPRVVPIGKEEETPRGEMVPVLFIHRRSKPGEIATRCAACRGGVCGFD